jgi:hypothetical protein
VTSWSYAASLALTPGDRHDLPTTRSAGFDALGIWRSWASDVRGEAFPCGHFLMEELPERTATALLAFFTTRVKE